MKKSILAASFVALMSATGAQAANSGSGFYKINTASTTESVYTWSCTDINSSQSTVSTSVSGSGAWLSTNINSSANGCDGITDEHVAAFLNSNYGAGLYGSSTLFPPAPAPAPAPEPAPEPA